MTLQELKRQQVKGGKSTDGKVTAPAELLTRYGENNIPLERQSTFLHSRLAQYLQGVHSLEPTVLKRYKRLSLHFIINKLDPLQLDEFKFAFLKYATGEDCTVPIKTLRKIIQLVLNDSKLAFDERVIEALVGDSTFDENTTVTFEQVQKLVDVYEAHCATLNESLADPRFSYNDPISGH